MKNTPTNTGQNLQKNRHENHQKRGFAQTESGSVYRFNFWLATMLTKCFLVKTLLLLFTLATSGG